MNQVHQTETFKPTSEKTVLKAEQNQRVRLTHGDARALHAVLIKGDAALAQRTDLGDLYKRIVTMISTLDTGLSERQEAQSSKIHNLLSTRLDGVERSINEVEGAFRIEMEPMLRATVNQAIEEKLSQTDTRVRPSLGRRLIQLLILCICFYIGSLFPSEIGSIMETISAYLSELISKITVFLPPDGGIGANSIPVE